MANSLPLHELPSQTSSPPSTAAPTEKPSSNSSSDSIAPGKPTKNHGTLIRDSIIGFSDGLTVPFALTAGLSSLGSTRIVILSGLAELFSGSISMGLGAYLASTQDKKQYESEERKLKESSEHQREQIFDAFARYGVEREECQGVVAALEQNEEARVQFMMDFDLKLSKPALKYSLLEGLVMGLSYFIGGLFPMIPYFIFTHSTTHALFVSIGITAVVLILFGIVRSRLIGGTLRDQFETAVMTLLLGSVAAGASYGIVYAVDKASVL